MSCVDSTRRAPAVKDHFSAIPNRLQDDPRLTPRDIAVVAAILRYARAKTWASMSNRTLASHCRCGERTVQLCLARLQACGWITRTPCHDAPGASGRLVYLNWRRAETDCAPPAKAVAPPAAQLIAPEVEGQKREDEPAPRSLDGSGPGRQTEAGPTPPPDPLDYAALGWLDRPANDPLRKIAEKALAARLAGPPSPRGVDQAVRPSRSLLRAPGSLAGMLGRQLGRS
jgi:hypothetical protein